MPRTREGFDSVPRRDLRRRLSAGSEPAAIFSRTERGDWRSVRATSPTVSSRVCTSMVVLAQSLSRPNDDRRMLGAWPQLRPPKPSPLRGGFRSTQSGATGRIPPATGRRTSTAMKSLPSRMGTGSGGRDRTGLRPAAAGCLSGGSRRASVGSAGGAFPEEPAACGRATGMAEPLAARASLGRSRRRPSPDYGRGW
jgi:hypothetical protein